MGSPRLSRAASEPAQISPSTAAMVARMVRAPCPTRWPQAPPLAMLHSMPMGCNSPFIKLGALATFLVSTERALMDGMRGRGLERDGLPANGRRAMRLILLPLALLCWFAVPAAA